MEASSSEAVGHLKPVIGLILAGGRSRRMGRDKAFIELNGKPLIAHAIERARPQVDALLINANDAARFAGFGVPVVPDPIGGFAGPLAGVLAGLEWTKANRAEAEWLATFACDTPFFPPDLVKRLLAAAEKANAVIAAAASGGQHHPVFALWRTTLATDVAQALNEGIRKMDDFLARHAFVDVPFAAGTIDPFFNINAPDDLARAERDFPPPFTGEVPSERSERGGGGSK